MVYDNGAPKNGVSKNDEITLCKVTPLETINNYFSSKKRSTTIQAACRATFFSIGNNYCEFLKSYNSVNAFRQYFTVELNITDRVDFQLRKRKKNVNFVIF